MSFQIHLIPDEEHQHIGSWDCYCGPEPADIDVFAAIAYRHQPAVRAEVSDGLQCAVFRCAELGNKFTDDQQWVCTQHAKGNQS